MTGSGIYEQIHAYCASVSAVSPADYNGDMVRAAQTATGLSRDMTANEAELLLLQNLTGNLTSGLADMRGYWPTILAGGYYSPQSLAIFANMTTPPTAARKTLINSMVNSLIAAGIWAKLGLLYICAAETSQAATLNWVEPSANALVDTDASATFITDRGFYGNGTSTFLSTAKAMNAMTPALQNTWHASAWAVTAGNGNPIIGATQSARLRVLPKSTRDVQMNSATTISTTADVTTGHIMGVRRDSTAVFSYRNGSMEVTGAATSTAFTSAQIIVLANAGAFSTSQVSMASTGLDMSAAEVTSFYNILLTYMQAVGAA